MNFYSIPTFITSFLVFFLGLFVYSKNQKSETNRAFFFMCLSTTAWLFLASIAYNHDLQPNAEFWMRICYIGIIYISITMFHFVSRFLNIKLWAYLLPLLYVYGAVCGFITMVSNHLISGTYK